VVGQLPCTNPSSITLPGQPVAVASNPAGFVVQIRELSAGNGQGPALVVSDGASVTETILLPGASMADTGHYLFHRNASASSTLACASCHPEGHDDGHVWVFDTLGSRRTPTVSGGVLATAPLHWSGDMSDLTDIMHEVFEKRMGGDPAQAGPRHVAAFAKWLQTLPAQPASPTGSQVQIDHGRQLFNSAETGCTRCHNGPHLTNNQTIDVGTGQAFQVPTLIGVAARAPFMHSGCAATLADRFDPNNASCNGGDSHGNTSQLSPSDVTDLVAYLETL
jgi:cytochrome c peroxidase